MTEVSNLEHYIHPCNELCRAIKREQHSLYVHCASISFKKVLDIQYYKLLFRNWDNSNVQIYYCFYVINHFACTVGLSYYVQCTYLHLSSKYTKSANVMTLVPPVFWQICWPYFYILRLKTHLSLFCQIFRRRSNRFQMCCRVFRACSIEFFY